MSLRAIAQATNAARTSSFSRARNGDLLRQGRYRLVEQQVLPENQQGQGTAWLALDIYAGAVSVVLREIVTTEQNQERRERLMRMIAARLTEASQHPGFPKVLDLFQEQGHSYLVLQHVEGESLASLLRRQGGALPEHTVVEYGRQLCEMLSVLSHLQPPLVHGAISPETVIVSPDRLRVHLVHLPLFLPKEPNSTAFGASYKAPEQASDGASPATDLYSVAATLHHAVTGTDPREQNAFFYAPARRLNPHVSEQMETILVQELRLATPQRYPHAAALQKDLATLLGSRSVEEKKHSTGILSGELPREILPMYRPDRQRNLLQIIGISTLCVVFLLGFLWLASSYSFFQGSNNSRTPSASSTATAGTLTNALNAEWQAEAPLYRTDHAGLSDGRYAFDTYSGHSSSAELDAKEKAAQALLNHDLKTALRDYQTAVTDDPTDAEARIYLADLQIEMQHDPFITIVLGLPLDDDPDHLAVTRPALQAAYEFQNRVNTQNGTNLPGNLKLRILVANSGAKDNTILTLASFIAKRVQLGNPEHILAVVGWPTGEETRQAVSILTAVKIPLISQLASNTFLDNISPYFFRVNPNDTIQGTEAGTYAYSVLQARKVLVLRDASNASSQALADAFTASFERLGGNVVDNSADYFQEHVTTVDTYQQAAAYDSVRNRVDLIYQPGFDDDAIRLAHAVSLEANLFPYLATMRILGSANVDTGLLLGQGVGPDTQLAQQNPQDLRHLVFTSYANSATWSSTPPTFLTDWQTLYGTSSASNPQAPVPTEAAIMTDDAFGVIVYATQWVNGPLTGENLRGALVSIGRNTTAAFQGVSGSISFGNDGNPLNKPVILLAVVASNGGNTIQPVTPNS